MPGRQVLPVYDDECPVCRNYCQAARIRVAAGELQLVYARESGKILQEITARELDIDRGMVLKLGDRYYHGADAIPVLALLSTRPGLFNRSQQPAVPPGSAGAHPLPAAALAAQPAA